MIWEEYKKKFRLLAIEYRFDEAYINRCLSYASKLNQAGLPIIYDLNHLSLLVGYDSEYLLRAISNKSNFYRAYQVAKKSGGKRDIAEPLPSLKEIQRWILDNILYKCSEPLNETGS